jgi:hypothetical protein
MAAAASIRKKPYSFLLARPGARAKMTMMKILLQHARTRLYVRGPGDWTSELHEAFDFQHSQRAIDFAHQHGLTGVQIAVKFIDSQFDEIFPLPVAMAAAAAVQPTA